MITATQAHAQIVVRRRLTWLPMTRARLVSTTSGTRANRCALSRAGSDHGHDLVAAVVADIVV